MVLVFVEFHIISVPENKLCMCKHLDKSKDFDLNEELSNKTDYHAE